MTYQVIHAGHQQPLCHTDELVSPLHKIILLPAHAICMTQQDYIYFITMTSHQRHHILNHWQNNRSFMCLCLLQDQTLLIYRTLPEYTVTVYIIVPGWSDPRSPIQLCQWRCGCVSGRPACRTYWPMDQDNHQHKFKRKGTTTPELKNFFRFSTISVSEWNSLPASKVSCVYPSYPHWLLYSQVKARQLPIPIPMPMPLPLPIPISIPTPTPTPHTHTHTHTYTYNYTCAQGCSNSFFGLRTNFMIFSAWFWYTSFIDIWELVLSFISVVA